MVDLFLLAREARPKEERAWWGDPSLSLEAACRRALFGLGGLRDKHQWTYSTAELEFMAEKLAVHADSLAASREFDELYRRIEGILGLDKNQKPLLVYDIAYRLGHRLDCAPRHVYLHAGPKKGAEALKLGLGRPRRRPLADFPTSIRTRLSPAQAEDFLCLAARNLRHEIWD